MKVAVIGTGPAGLACANSLIDLASEIHVIDSWEQISNNAEGPSPRDAEKKIAQKSKWNSLKMYDYPREYIEFPDSETFPISATFGGLSTVWGANLWFCSPSELGLPEALTDDFNFASEKIKGLIPIFNASSKSKQKPENPKAHQLLSNRIKNIVMESLPSETNKTKMYGSVLALDEGKCYACGLCLTGCSVDAIYATEYSWPSLLENPKVIKVEGLVDKISIRNNSKIEIALNSSTATVLTYDKVYLACGAIASAALLQRSGLVDEHLIIKDTQVYYLPLISVRRKDIESRISLAQAFVNGKTPVPGHISIYETSEEIKLRVQKKIGSVSKLIPNIFWNRLLAGIGFLDTEKSGILFLSKNDSGSKLSSRIKRSSKFWALTFIFCNFKIFFKSGLFPLPLLPKLPNPGASYHVGSTTNIHNDFITHLNGEVCGHKNLYVVDSTSFRKIPVGPITASVMSNSWRIARESIKVDNA